MKRFIVCATKLLLLLPFAAVAAGAPDETPAPACGSYKEALVQLKEHYNEIPVWIGQNAGGGQIVVTQSPKGTWTIFAVKPSKVHPDDGIACMLMDDGGDNEPGSHT
jgi:hypothetical protein